MFNYLEIGKSCRKVYIYTAISQRDIGLLGKSHYEAPCMADRLQYLWLTRTKSRVVAPTLSKVRRRTAPLPIPRPHPGSCFPGPMSAWRERLGWGGDWEKTQGGDKNDRWVSNKHFRASNKDPRVFAAELPGVVTQQKHGASKRNLIRLQHE